MSPRGSGSAAQFERFTHLLLLPPGSLVPPLCSYSVLIVGALLLIAMLFWYIHGKKNFRGPESLIEALRHQEGLNPSVGLGTGTTSYAHDMSAEEKGSWQTAEHSAVRQ